MSIDFRCGDARVAQQPLNEANINSGFNKERRGRVPQHVGSNPACYAYIAGILA